MTSTEENKYHGAYIDSFGDPSTDEGEYKKDSRLAKAYETALDIRKFEIDLYWKRSTSFWLLVGGIAAALGFMLSGKITDAEAGVLANRGKEIVCCGLSLAGATISYAWSLVNEGSKFWQRNWEYQVDILEQRVLGPLYKTVFADKDSKIMYSVSAINIWISRYLFIIFSLATIAFVIGVDGKIILLNAVTTLVGWVGGWFDPKYFVDSDQISKIFAFISKLLLVSINVWLVLKVRDRVRTNRETDKQGFDANAEASVRAIFIGERHGTRAAFENWAPPVAKVDTNVKGIKKFVSAFFKPFF